MRMFWLLLVVVVGGSNKRKDEHNRQVEWPGLQRDGNKYESHLVQGVLIHSQPKGQGRRTRTKVGWVGLLSVATSHQVTYRNTKDQRRTNGHGFRGEMDNFIYYHRVKVVAFAHIQGG